MYTLYRTITQTLISFLISIGCSIVFAIMVYKSESALPNRFISSILNLSALLLFLFIQCRVWSRLYLNSSYALEYFIPALTATTVLTAIAALFYINKSYYYKFLFFQTRFLEPVLTSSYDYVSFLVAQGAMYILVFLTPSITFKRQ